PGTLLFLAVCLPWYVAAQIRNPEFFREFILRQNFARFGSPLYHHIEPFWYYFPLTLLGLLPWTIYIAAAVTESVRKLWARKREYLVAEDALSLFLLIWFLVPVVFFSLSQSKLPGYILPALPAATLLLAVYVRQHALAASVQPILRIALHSVVASALMVPGLMAQYIVLQHRIPWGKACAISLTLAVILAIGISVTLRSVGLRMLRFVTLVPVILSVSAVLRIGAPSLDSLLSARPLANQVRSLAISPLPIAVFNVSRETQFGLAFYCDQGIDRYEYGQVPAGEHLLIAREGLQAQIAAGARGARVSYLGSFAPQGLDYYLVSPRTP
ncbi:MAG: hypothetical protein JOY93_06565, partial [Acidobacteriales bacterium]|nr:hypothetical protein [Terriglobales bacterium]